MSDKTASLDFHVSAKGKKSVIETEIVFTTRDDKTAKFIFNLKDKNGELDLTDATAELTLRMADRSRFNRDVPVVGKTSGILEYTLEEEIIRHHGIAVGQLCVYYPDSSLSFTRFKFRIDPALIDEEIEVVQTYYFSDFESLKEAIQKRSNEIKEELNTVFTEENAKITEQATLFKKQVETLITEVEDMLTKSYTDIKSLVKTLDDMEVKVAGLDFYSRAQMDQKLGDVSQQLADTSDILSRRDITPVETKIIGHRGSQQAPENTIAAVKKAAELGYWGAECDPKLTKDKEIIIMHDNTLDRTTNGTGSISDYTLAEIKELNVIYDNTWGDYSLEKVPTFEEQVIACKKYNLVCVVHGSLPGYSGKMLEIIKKHDMENNTVFLTDLDFCRELRDKSKKLTLFYISFKALNKEDIDIALKNKVGLSYASNYSAAIDETYKENIRYAHSKNVVLNAWVENDKVRFQTLKEYNVQYVTTDVLILDNLNPVVGEKQLQHTRHVITKSEYLYNMSAAMKVEHVEIPLSNGYYFDSVKNILYCNSPAGTQGFAYYRNIGAVRAGDVIELFTEIKVTNGSFRTAYDLVGKLGLNPEILGVGRHKIYRKFVVPFDSISCTLTIGAATADIAEYQIIGGINISISSNINYKKTSLGTVLVSGTASEERFSVYNNTGDECVITKVSDYYIEVTFSESLIRRGIPVVTLDTNADKYQIRTSSATANSVRIKFLDTTFTQVLLSSLPNYMYVNVALI